MADKTPAEQLAELKAQRAQRAKDADTAADPQRVIDMTAVLDLEARYGANGVKVIHLPVTAGLPTLVVVRRAEPAYLKRYRASQKFDKGGRVDLGTVNDAAEAVADHFVVYPDAETYARVRETFGGIHSQAGLASVKLAEGHEDDEGKDS